MNVLPSYYIIKSCAFRQYQLISSYRSLARSTCSIETGGYVLDSDTFWILDLGEGFGTEWEDDIMVRMAGTGIGTFNIPPR